MHDERRENQTDRSSSQIDASTVQRQVLDCEDRDYQLWSIVIVAFLAVGAGFATIVLPNVVWGVESSENQGRYLPQLVVGFITLIIFFNIYVIGQRRTLRETRAALLEHAIRAEKAQAESFIDPLTGLFNRRYMDYLIPLEAKRTDRADGVFALLMVDVNDFKTVNNRLGHPEGDRFLQRVAQVLKRTFRQTDCVIRYGGDEFLVLMPDTNERNARRAARRLVDEVAAWNAANRSVGCTMELSCGIGCYTKGGAIDSVLELADQHMYSQKRSVGERATAAHV